MKYPSVAFVRRCRAGVATAVVLLGIAGVAAGQPKTDEGNRPHTFDGRHDISKIDLTVVYLVPKDRRPLDDWRERVELLHEAHRGIPRAGVGVPVAAADPRPSRASDRRANRR